MDLASSLDRERPGHPHAPLRCAILPPTPTPYREPLFAQLARSEGLETVVIYLSAREPSWDVPAAWFPSEHPYPAVHLRSWQHRRAGRTPIVWPRGLEHALAKADPDCVVASEFGPSSLRALRWCRSHGRAFVVLTECTQRIDPLLSGAQLRVHRWFSERADGFIAVSSAARERLLAFGVSRDRIAVAPQSADVERFRAAVSHAPKNGPVTVLSVGRLVPDKNLAGLLDAFARARFSPAQARLEFIGAGFLEDELRIRARTLGVAVRFRGHLAPRELPAAFAAGDALALVSTYEPFGVVIREAAAAGLPILCSRVAGAAGEIAIEGRNALLVDPTCVEEIADALRRLVEDEPLRRRMSAHSRAIDADVDGRDVEAFATAITAAAHRRGRGRSRA